MVFDHKLLIHQLKLSSIFIFGFLFCYDAFAQKEKIDENIIQRIMENLSEESDNQIDIEPVIQELVYYQQNPLDLNSAIFKELNELALLSAAQIDAILQHIQKVGKLLNIYELQSIKYFDLTTIEQILPFVKVGGEIDDLNISLKNLLTKGNHVVFARYEEDLEDRAAYLNGNYLGSPAKIYVRHRYEYNKNISYGITAEKDAHEPFGGPYNKEGFDFYSAHLYLKDFGPLKYTAIGDYKLNIGQGLALWNDFATRKSDEVMSIMKNAYLLKPYTSASEYDFLRGLAGTLSVGEIDVTAFGSYKGLDANVSVIDTFTNEIREISSIQIDGIHRSINELEDKKTVKELLGGLSLVYDERNLELGIAGIYSKLSKPLLSQNRVDNLFQFNGDELFNASFNYRYLYQNFHFFGELALSDDLTANNLNKTGFASVNGVLVSVDTKVRFSLVHRYFNKYYEARYAKAFAESSTPNNENGLYFGVIVTPNQKVNISAYADTYKHNWLKFRAQAPSKGFDYRTKIIYKPSRKIELSLRYRNERKFENLTNNNEIVNYIVPRTTASVRANVNYRMNANFSFKTRIEQTTFVENNRPKEYGYLFFQDVSYSSIKLPFSFNARFALFDTDGFNSRVFVYENNVLYGFNNRQFSGTGYRYYLNAKLKVTRFLTFWAKIEQTKFVNLYSLEKFEGYRSGNDFVDADTQTRVTLQARFKF